MHKKTAEKSVKIFLHFSADPLFRSHLLHAYLYLLAKPVLQILGSLNQPIKKISMDLHGCIDREKFDVNLAC